LTLLIEHGDWWTEFAVYGGVRSSKLGVIRHGVEWRASDAACMEICSVTAALVLCRVSVWLDGVWACHTESPLYSLAACYPVAVLYKLCYIDFGLLPRLHSMTAEKLADSTWFAGP
jgi:hypothetical protein